MHFNEYQAEARKTAIYPAAQAVVYPTLGLSGEVGEVSEKVKKAIRDHNGVSYLIDTPEAREGIKKEIGDVLWYIATLSADLGLNLEEVAQSNLDKLKSRQNRGVLQGSGDAR